MTTRAVALIWTAALGALLALTFGIHQRANAAPVQPTWQQSVVTIDDKATVAAAQAWGAPFEIRYAAQGADIHVSTSELADMTGGEATKVLDGDRITGCSIVVEPRNAANVTVLAHEVGHCFGVGHDRDHEDSLMFWIQGGASGAQGVTDVDRAALAALYAGAR